VTTVIVVPPRTPYVQIPHKLLLDPRLPLEARALAGILGTFRPGRAIRVTLLPYLLKADHKPSKHYGIYQVRRSLRDLERAGYIRRNRHRTDGGRIEWQLFFALDPADLAAAGPMPTMCGPTTYGETADGDAVDGAAADGDTADGVAADGAAADGGPADNQDHLGSSTSVVRKKNQTSGTKTGPLIAELSDGLVFRTPLVGDALADARRLVRDAPHAMRQAVLDEVTAMHLHRRVTSPLGLLKTLVAKAKDGRFEPTTAKRYARELDASRTGITAPSRSPGGAESTGDIARRALERMRATVRRPS
jgi:hypothetical protein